MGLVMEVEGVVEHWEPCTVLNCGAVKLALIGQHLTPGERVRVAVERIIDSDGRLSFNAVAIGFAGKVEYLGDTPPAIQEPFRGILEGGTPRPEDQQVCTTEVALEEGSLLL